MADAAPPVPDTWPTGADGPTLTLHRDPAGHLVRATLRVPTPTGEHLVTGNGRAVSVYLSGPVRLDRASLRAALRSTDHSLDNEGVASVAKLLAIG